MQITLLRLEIHKHERIFCKWNSICLTVLTVLVLNVVLVLYVSR